MRIRFLQTSVVGALALLASMSACTDDALVAPALRIAALRLTPAVVNVVENGGQAPLRVEAIDTGGAVVAPSPAVSFSVRDTAIAAVDGRGVVTGWRFGTTVVYARVVTAGGAVVDSAGVAVGRFSSGQ